MARVRNPGCSRGVRSDDHQIDVALSREPRDRLPIGDIDGDALGDRGRAAVARRDDHRDAWRIAQAGPGKRMLASPGSDDEDSPYSHSMVDGGLLEMS